MEYQGKGLMNLKQAAEFLGMSESALRHLVELRKVPYMKPKGYARLFFQPDAMLEWAGSGICVTVEDIVGKAKRGRQ